MNGWLLYQRHCDVIQILKKQRKSLVEFTSCIADTLIDSGKVRFVSETPARQERPKKRSLEETHQAEKPGRRPTVPLPSNNTQYDQVGHWPELSNDKRGRCRHCADGFSKIFCSKCKVCLCLRYGKSCFIEYHTK